MTNEAILRQIIRKKIKASLSEKYLHEQALRKAIRKILSEGDISDTHPHRSTGINMLEDVLKKSIPSFPSASATPWLDIIVPITVSD